MVRVTPEGHDNDKQAASGNHTPAPWSTRAQATETVARRWLDCHREIDVSPKDLRKVLTQLVTEVFQTGRQRRHGALSAHALSLLETVGTNPESFGAARMASITADLPPAECLIFAELTELLAPLAAAVQLARIPVTNAAARLLADRPGTGSLTRRELRGFVVAAVRPRAQELHHCIGFGQSAGTYLRLLLDDVDSLAESVVNAAIASAARSDTLTDEAAERLAAFAEESLPRLRRLAALYHNDPDEIVGITMAKLATALCNRPDMNLEYAYAARALQNHASDVCGQLTHRAAIEDGADSADRVAADRDDLGLVDMADVVLRHVLSVARHLNEVNITPEHSAARQALLRYFLDDPMVVDPRRAKLAAHVLSLSAPSGRDDEIRTGLETIAAEITTNRAAAQRISRVALAALRIAA